MTIKELAAFRNQIMEYYEIKANLEMLEKERPIVNIGRNPDYEDLKEALEKYEKQKENFDKLCKEYDYDGLKEKCTVKYVFPDVPQNEESLLQSFLDDITVTNYTSKEYVKEALDLIDALAKESGFCDRTLEEDILININRAVAMYNYPDEGWDLSQGRFASEEYASIYECLLKITNTDTKNNITELQQILEQHGMGKEAQQVSLLLEQIQAMQQNYNIVFQELKAVRNQLDQLQNMPQIGTPSAIVNQMAAFEGSVQNQYKQFQDMRKQMNAKAGTLIQKFKEIGIKALSNVCKFLGIKENLIKMRDAARSNAAEAKSIIEKVDSIGNEVKKTGVHLRNIGRAAAGKELIDPEAKEQLKIFRSLKSHYEKNLNIFEKRTERLNASIEKVDKLEKAADRVSVRDKLANNRKSVEAKDASASKIEKEKPHHLDAVL